MEAVLFLRVASNRLRRESLDFSDKKEGDLILQQPMIIVTNAESCLVKVRFG